MAVLGLKMSPSPDPFTRSFLHRLIHPALALAGSKVTRNRQKTGVHSRQRGEFRSLATLYFEDPEARRVSEVYLLKIHSSHVLKEWISISLPLIHFLTISAAVTSFHTTFLLEVNCTALQRLQSLRTQLMRAAP